MQTSAKDDVGVEDSFKKVIEDTVQINLINMAFSNKKDNNKELKMESMPMKKSCEC